LGSSKRKILDRGESKSLLLLGSLMDDPLPRKYGSEGENIHGIKKS